MIYKPEDIYFKAITNDLILFMHNIFNDDSYETDCCIFIDENANCPMLITNITPLLIRLTVRKTSYWCQVIFQLSHELMHYYIRSKKKNKDDIIKWFEETICESFSYLALNYFSENWEATEIGRFNPQFAIHVNEYLNLELEKAKDGNLFNCLSLEELQKIESESENKRELRSLERNYVYKLMQENIYDIGEIANYTDYIIPETILIDFNKWNSVIQNRFIFNVKKIQPNLNI